MTGHPILILAVINVTAFSLGWYARGRAVHATLGDTTKVWEKLSSGRAFTIQILASATGVPRWRVRLALAGLEGAGKVQQTWIGADRHFPGQLLWRATTEPTPHPGART